MGHLYLYLIEQSDYDIDSSICGDNFGMYVDHCSYYAIDYLNTLFNKQLTDNNSDLISYEKLLLLQLNIRILAKNVTNF